jgi:probable addiction module antidote protein
MKPIAFEISDFLDSEEMIATYLNTVLEEGDEDDLVVAIGNVAKAIGMGKIAQQTGMSRTSLYKAFAEGANPQFQTVLKVLRSLGSEIKVSPIN